MGAHILQQALQLGHEVTILVRDVRPVCSHPNLKVLAGNALDANAVNAAVEGQDAVLYALGSRSFTSTKLFSASTRVLIDAMHRNNVPRLIVLTGIGAGDSKGHGGWFYDNIIYPLFTRRVYVDKDAQEALIRSSGLNWTIVRAAPFNNGPLGGRLRATDQLSGVTISAISRADTAAFMLDQLNSSEWLHRAPLVGY